MQPKQCRPSEVERYVKSRGFIFRNQTGSHRMYKHLDGRLISIPFHPGDVKVGTLRSIIRQLGITVEEFNRTIK